MVAMNGTAARPRLIHAPRTDFETPNGRVIRAHDVSVGAGVYAADGKRFACVHLLDPALGKGRLIYVLTKEEALAMADGLRRAAEAAS